MTLPSDLSKKFPAMLIRSLVAAADEGNDTEVARILDKDPGLINLAYLDATALALAAREGHLSTVKLLLTRGAEINLQYDTKVTPGSRTETPLTGAAYRGKKDVVSFLLANGADVDPAAGNNDRTALHNAALCGHTDIVWMLLQAGADCECEDKSDSTAQALAVDRHPETASVLEQWPMQNHGLRKAIPARRTLDFARSPKGATI